MVAEMPGYPIRKLPFAGPETRTKAAISISQFPHHHGHAEEGAQGSCGEPANLTGTLSHDSYVTSDGGVEAKRRRGVCGVEKLRGEELSLSASGCGGRNEVRRVNPQPHLRSSLT